MASPATPAASIGRDFSFDILAQASDLEEDALVRALDELWRRHIVRVQADDRWDFSHDRIREVAYSALSPAQQRDRHLRIARAMELLPGEDHRRAAALMAAHLDATMGQCILTLYRSATYTKLFARANLPRLKTLRRS